MFNPKALIFLLLISSSLAFNGGRIIGGEETPIERLPYIAALQQRVIFVYFVCGASIISTKHLLTAAHCLPENNSNLYARVGATAYNSGGQFLKVDKFLEHPLYDGITLNYDFAVTTFADGAEIVLGPKVAIIPLPSPSDGELENGSALTVAGWGYTSDATTDYSLNLRVVDMPVVSREQCETVYPRLGPTLFCAEWSPEGQIKNFCMGDSGGPGVQNGVLHGVISGVHYTGCEKPKPSVLGRVGFVLDWIKNVTDIE